MFPGYFDASRLGVPGVDCHWVVEFNEWDLRLLACLQVVGSMQMSFELSIHHSHIIYTSHDDMFLE